MLEGLALGLARGLGGYYRGREERRRWDAAQALREEDQALRRAQMAQAAEAAAEARRLAQQRFEMDQQRQAVQNIEAGFTPVTPDAVVWDAAQGRDTIRSGALDAVPGLGGAAPLVANALDTAGRFLAQQQAKVTGGYAKTGMNAQERAALAQAARDTREADRRAREQQQERDFTLQRDRDQRAFVAAENAKNRGVQMAGITARYADSGGPPGRPIPSGVVQELAENDRSLATIDEALAALEADPRALGVKAYVPQVILNQMDPKGVAARAAVADIGSLEIRERSGAAVTAREAPRLKPFVPLPTDDAETAKTKLRRLRAAIQQERDAIGSYYSPEQGYMPMPTSGRAPAPDVRRDRPPLSAFEVPR